MTWSTSLSFPDHSPVSIKFREDEASLASLIRSLGSAGIREVLGLHTWEAVEREARRRDLPPRTFLRDEIARLARSREVRYDGWPAGESSDIDSARALMRRGAARFLDPFAGRGELAAAAAQEGLDAWYCEISTVFAFIAEARISALGVADRASLIATLRRFEESLAHLNAKTDPLLDATRGHLLPGPHSEAVLDAIDLLQRVRTAIDQTETRIAADILAVAVIEALPRTTGELETGALRRAIRREILRAVAFLEQEATFRTPPRRAAFDVDDLSLLPSLDIDLVVTEPPSLNFASYAPSLAGWFLGVRVPGLRRRSLAIPDAMHAIRHPSLRHGAAPPANRKVADKLAARIGQEIASVKHKSERMARIGANYFADMARWIATIALHVTDNATVAIRVRDSKLAGVPISTERYLAAMLELYGFEEEPGEGFLVMRR